ncbi:axial regulator YABBY 5-like isoform X1 [Carica papaya]|uniref:axial regulator YABBY 5-like isoform X1 n=2 Tax=Carica papaya TaxID=3649 RepID=UPI000B8CF5D9|nr:axial regulator YABBY 5-like isoform X1 [Carica papaya]
MSSSNGFECERLCYMPCKHCKIVVAVRVPCSSLYDIVTIRCVHCSNLWSVNMAATLQSMSTQDLHQAHNYYNTYLSLGTELGSSSNCNKKETKLPEAPTFHPSGKRQRGPSAYNQFMKEEIQRIKAINPCISHKQAFTTAAKNWAHLPHTHFGLTLGGQQSGCK